MNCWIVDLLISRMVKLLKCWIVEVFKWESVQVFKCLSVQVFKCSCVQVLTCWIFDLVKCLIVRLLNCWIVELFNHWPMLRGKKRKAGNLRMGCLLTDPYTPNPTPPSHPITQPLRNISTPLSLVSQTLPPYPPLLVAWRWTGTQVLEWMGLNIR